MSGNCDARTILSSRILILQSMLHTTVLVLFVWQEVLLLISFTLFLCFTVYRLSE